MSPDITPPTGPISIAERTLLQQDRQRAQAWLDKCEVVELKAEQQLAKAQGDKVLAEVALGKAIEAERVAAARPVAVRERAA
jgi:hypothetical protein